MLYSLIRPQRGRTWKERIASFCHKSVLVLESVVVAAMLTFAWWFIFWKNGLRFGPESEVRISTLILVQVGLLGFIAAVTIIKVVDRSEEKSRYVRCNDELGFMIIRDIRIPVRMHMLFGALASGLMLLISVFGYERAAEGLIAVFVSTFSLIFYFSIIMELQDPHRSTWFRVTTPDDWLTQDADEFFERLTEGNAGVVIRKSA